jgi:hypothetical protein
LEKVVMSPTYDPTSRPGKRGVEQPDPGLGQDPSTGEDRLVDEPLGQEPGLSQDTGAGQAPQSSSFADSDLEYAQTNPGRESFAQPVDYGRDPYDQSGNFGGRSNSTVDTAKDEAANVKDTAAGAASDVAQTAKSEASHVAYEAKQQARNLIDQTQSELRGQASNQQSAVAEKLHGWASELGSMASKSDESGQMSDLAQEASHRVGEISHWLDSHEPADLLDEVKRFARRRPVAFLALAAAAGIVAGRVTRGAVAANTDVDSDRAASPARAYDSDVYRDGYSGAMTGSAAHSARGYDDSAYGTRYREDVDVTSYADSGSGVTGQYSGAGPMAPDTGSDTSNPDVTPGGEEPNYPPQAGGDVRR